MTSSVSFAQHLPVNETHFDSNHRALKPKQPLQYDCHAATHPYHGSTHFLVAKRVLCVSVWSGSVRNLSFSSRTKNIFSSQHVSNFAHASNPLSLYQHFGEAPFPGLPYVLLRSNTSPEISSPSTIHVFCGLREPLLHGHVEDIDVQLHENFR